MNQFFNVDLNTVFTGILIILAGNWFKKMNDHTERQNLNAPNQVTMEMINQMQTAMSNLVTKIAEINVWKDGHLENDAIAHDALNNRIKILERVS